MNRPKRRSCERFSDPLAKLAVSASHFFMLKMATDLLSHLRELEVALHQPKVRRDPTRLNQLLHNSFSEFGRSGRSYSRDEILELLSHEVPSRTIWSQDFTVAEIAEDVALLTYKSAYIDANGELGRHTLRSSLWQRTALGWRMRFHQGTPTDAFAKNET